MKQRLISRILFAALCVVSPLTAETWPRFRGSNGQGHSAEPRKWGANENIAWRVEIW